MGKNVYLFQSAKYAIVPAKVLIIDNATTYIILFQVARNKQGQPRGYALIDYATVTEAEKGQEKLDGTQIGESNIRISFCTPGKTAQEIFAKFDDSVS